MKRKIISMLIILALLMPMTTVFEQQKSVAQAEETTEDDYIEITNAAELYAIRNNLSANYRLMNDIDLTEATSEGGELNNTGYGWDPIDGFSGVFDGNGHYIKGMQIYGTFNDWYDYPQIGLFGTAGYGQVILNLGMIDVNIDIISETPIECGGIVGDGYNIQNCFVSGNIKIVTDGYSDVGGIAGNASLIKSCINMANVEVAAEYPPSIGNYVGGITGNGNVDTCINLGKVTWDNELTCAIMRADDERYESISNCFYLVGNSLGSGEGKTALTEAQMKNKAFFTNLDFENTWIIDGYSTFKYPQLRSCMFNRVKSLEIEQPPRKLVYQQGEPLDLTDATATITYADDFNTTIILTEDYLGQYDMNKVGEQRIPVVAGNQTAYFSITVNSVPVTQINMSEQAIKVNKGYTYQLAATVAPPNATNKNVVWSSADENIAVIDQNGLITAKSKGTTTITATSTDGITATCQVTVTIPCVVLQLDNYDVTINKGDSIKMGYKMSPIDCTDTVKWTSSDENILSIDVDNNWIGKNAGNVTVTGTTDSGVTAICTVTVMQDLSEFTVLDIVNKNYTGKAITQKPKVTNGSKTLQAGVHYTVSYSANKNVGTASMVITGIKPYKGTLTRTFNILPADLKNTKISKVKITAIKAAKKKLTIRWKKVKNAVGYEIQVAQNKKFTKGKKTYRVNAKTLKKVFKGSKKKTYYVRVRAYAYDSNGQTVNGSFSKIKKMKTK